MRIELLGRGGEPVDFARTLLSHGVADLPPNAVAQDGTALDTVLLIDGEARPVRVVADGPGFARIDTAAAEPVIRHMLRLDEDFSAFYLVAAADPALAWAAAGAGRMLRSPTVFEDLVKTICTTNCTWSATVRMVTALVGVLGTPAGDSPERRAFPTPEAMAEAGEDFYTDIAKTGYRGPYLRTIAADVAEGRLDLEALNDPALSDVEVTERLLALPGRRAVRLRARDDAARPLPAADPRFLDAPDLPPPRRPPAGDRRRHREGLPALPRVRRAGVLAHAHTRLGDR